MASPISTSPTPTPRPFFISHPAKPHPPSSTNQQSDRVNIIDQQVGDRDKSARQCHPSSKETVLTHSTSTYTWNDADYASSGPDGQRDHQNAPHCRALAVTDDVSRYEKNPMVATTAISPPSAPIPISNYHHHSHQERPITPLTGREEKRGAFFPFHDSPSSPRPFSQSLWPEGQTQSLPSLPDERMKSVYLPPSRKKSSVDMHKDEPSSLRHSPSPLSPSVAHSSPQRSDHQGTRLGRASKNLHISSLPRFQPTSSQPANANPTNNLRPFRSRPVHHRSYVESQNKLHQQQRDLIVNATRPARSLIAQGLSKPSPPRLHPLGSPGPVTPLLLERESGDYLIAGATRQPAVDGTMNETVDKLIRQEKDRLDNPGNYRGRYSPAVSPAGGRS